MTPLEPKRIARGGEILAKIGVVGTERPGDMLDVTVRRDEAVAGRECKDDGDKRNSCGERGRSQSSSTTARFLRSRPRYYSINSRVRVGASNGAGRRWQSRDSTKRS